MPLSAILQPAGVVDVVSTRSRLDLSPDEVRISVSRAGVNYWEVLQRQGKVAAPDSGALGSEGCGRVVAVGGGVEELEIGDRVAWFRVPGSYAKEVTAPSAACYRVPDSVDDETAAGLLFQGATALYLAEQAWPLAAGASALVTAAAGGVGHLLVQLLRARGVHVTGLVSDEAKLPLALASGADRALTYDEALSDESLNRKFDAIYDSVGGDFARRFLAWLRPRGCIVVYGAGSGTEAAISAGDLAAGSFFLTRTAGRDYITDLASAGRHASTLLHLAGTGRLKVHLGSTFSLENSSAALDALESRSSTGKVLIAP